jgi:hypothetical protein
MDPYLEAPDLWEDFHARLAAEISDQLMPRLRPRYFARLAPYVVLAERAVEEPAQRAKPDVALYQLREVAEAYTVAAPASATTQPPAITPPALIAAVEEFRLQRIEILKVGGKSLVTVIEILSPINKRAGHKAQADYARKRRKLLQTNVHLLEIDLLRGGRRPCEPEVELPPAPYFVFLSRAKRRDQLEIWPIPLAEPLPVVPVPLRAPDPDVPLDLGAALRAIYDRAGYDLILDYRRPPPRPDLSPEETAWVAALLRPVRAKA